MTYALGLLSTILFTSNLAKCEFVASFDHGVASGDPLPGNVVIWTKATPRGASFQNIYVDWRVSEISLDLTEMSSLPPPNGTVKADGDSDFTVKVEVPDLSEGKVVIRIH
jgi:alkaline phosphatase D